MYSSKDAPLSLRLPLQARVSLVSPRRRAVRPRRAPRHQSLAGASRTFVQRARATHSRTHRLAQDFHMFLHDALFAISTRCSGIEGTLAGGFQEGDIASGLAAGGRILGIFVVERALSGGPGYIAYLRASWKRGFHGLRTYRDRSDRVYRDLDRLVRLIRDEFGYSGPITLLVAGAPELRRFRALLPEDGRDSVSSNSQSHPGAPLRTVRTGFDPRRRQARRGASQSRRGKPAQKRGIIPTPARRGRVALPTRDGAALSDDGGTVSLTRVVLALSCSPHPQWTRT